MVTRVRGGWKACGAVLALAGLLCLADPAGAASGNLVFLTVKQGLQDAEGTGDTLFKRLERDHGKLRGDRQVTTVGLELDFYAIAGRTGGLAVGTEVSQYSQTFRFRTSDTTKTDEDLTLGGRSMLFTLKGFLRWGPVLPFIAIGSGNYYVEYHQSTEDRSLLDSAPNVVTARVGTRVLLGRWGLLLEAGATDAPLRVQTQSGVATLNLGGAYANAGISWLW